MRKFLFFVAVLCTSCRLYDRINGISIYDHIREPELEFSSFSECGNWIADNIYYQLNDPYIWQAPQVTIEKRTGMCVDFSILLLWYAVKCFEADPDNSYLFGVEHPDGGKHMMCVINGVLYEPQDFSTMTIQYYTPLETYSLEEALEICYYDYGSRHVFD